ncbi:MAG: GNAT family N-acetyltransferase [Peptostreptococcaceae bacterium]
MSIYLSNIKIRPLQEKDLDSASNIIIHAFSSKFDSLIPLPKDSIVSLLKDCNFVGLKGYEGHFVAELNNEILGIISLKWKSLKPSTKFTPSLFFDISKKYGYKNTVKGLLGLIALDKSISPTECYIDYISVHPKAHGLGIGTMLLNYGRDFAKNTLLSKKYTLYVTTNNIKALNLYKKLGFEVKKTLNSNFSKYLFNEKSFFYMENDLTN